MLIQENVQLITESFLKQKKQKLVYHDVAHDRFVSFLPKSFMFPWQ